MKAAVFKGIGQPLSVEQVPDPTPAADQVVMKIGRCGVCGTDLHMTEDHGMIMPSGFIPGHEYAGEVVAVGSAVSGLKVGDRIASMPMQGCGKCGPCLSGLSPWWCANGARHIGAGFAEYVLAGETNSIKLPSSLSIVDGALIEPLAVGLHGARLANIPVGAKILVIGAGSIGLGAAYYARRLGAGPIAIMASSRRREPQAQALGIDKFLVPAEGEDPLALVSAALGGMPDIVFEAVGLPGTLGQAINHVRPRGAVVVLGCCTEPDSFVPAAGLYKEVKMQFSMVYDIGDYEYVARTLDSGAIEPRALVTQTVGFDQFPDAFEALRHRSPQCKLMLDPTI